MTFGIRKIWNDSDRHKVLYFFYTKIKTKFQTIIFFEKKIKFNFLLCQLCIEFLDDNHANTCMLIEGVGKNKIICKTKCNLFMMLFEYLRQTTRNIAQSFLNTISIFRNETRWHWGLHTLNPALGTEPAAHEIYSHLFFFTTNAY